jgi:hypothetical protein
VSIRAITWAFDQKCGNPAAKLVLIKLADNANDDFVCWPSTTYLERHCELSRTAIKENIFKLAELGHLAVQHRSKNGVNLTNIYHLGPAAETFKAAGGGRAPGDPGRAPGDRGVGRQATPESSFLTVIEPKIPAPTAPEPAARSPSRMVPEIKKAADPIYRSDPQKFERLIVWIKHVEKSYPTQVIVKTLNDFEPYAAETEDWWPYLMILVAKAGPKINIAASEAEHRRHKEDIREASKNPFFSKMMKDVGS